MYFFERVSLKKVFFEMVKYMVYLYGIFKYIVNNDGIFFEGAISKKYLLRKY